MASATQDSRIRFGVIGCGVVAPTHAIALEGIARAELVAVADNSESRVQNFAREFGVPKAYTSHEELLADPDIDAICVCTPHHLHAPIAIDAARAGKHVLIEKPMATNLADADELIRLCDEGDLRLGVVFQHRFDAASTHIKRLVDDGDLGTIALASVYVKWFRAADYYDPSSWRGKWDTAGGGVLVNQAIHALDVLCWFVGDVKSVVGYAGARVHDIEVEDTAAAAIRFACGAFGVVEASTTTYPQTDERIEIAGSAGTVTIEGGQIVQHELAGRRAETPEFVLEDSRFRGKSYYGTSHPRVIEDFVEAIHEGRAPAVDGREGRKVLEVIFAIYESSRTGREVVLGGTE